MFVGVRLLRNFESPYLSIHLLNQKSAALGVFYFVIIRKLVWDPRIEEEMLDDPGAVLLLYKQVVFTFYTLFCSASRFGPATTAIASCFSACSWLTFTQAGNMDFSYTNISANHNLKK